MKRVICPVCSNVCIKYGKNKSGYQRWFCKNCSSIYTPKIDNSSKQLQIFLRWLFGKQSQNEIPGERRTFRRNTSQFWEIWTLPPKIEEHKDAVYVDGIYLGRKACILICCDDEHGSTFVKGSFCYQRKNSHTFIMHDCLSPAIIVVILNSMLPIAGMRLALLQRDCDPLFT